jgi:hypothetical protein
MRLPTKSISPQCLQRLLFPEPLLIKFMAVKKLRSCQYDGTVNDYHTSGRFDPLFSWELPALSREYDSCFLVSHLVMSSEFSINGTTEKQHIPDLVQVFSQENGGF